jgi:AcrR family transcriptional regulator
MTAPRTRDPARKERILSAAADLVARNGFTAVSMEDIGEAVGITASAIYRHYDSKSAVLVAMFDRVVDRLLGDGQAIAASRTADPADALARLVEGHIDFVINDRDVAQVYFREIAQVPAADRRRLRRNQRLYVEEWVLLLTELRPGLDDSAARALVHAAIGVIQSTLWYSAGLPADRLRSLLRACARGVLSGTVDPVPAAS